jgi:O-antigen/teichoic acid export membrane protein
MGNGFWAVGDQGVVSLGNFMTQIILARSLAPVEYGRYILFFGVLLVLFTSHGSLITYPLSLRGATAGEQEMRELSTGSLLLTLLLGIPFAAFVYATAWVLKIRELAWFVLLALILWQLQETLRRAMMSQLRHRDALWGDALSYLGQVVVLWFIADREPMSLKSAFLALAATSGAAALLQAGQLGFARVRRSYMSGLVRGYWRLGRWALFNSLSDTGSRQAFPWALAILCGPQQVASYQAAMNLLGVSHPVLYGAANVIVPAAAAEHRRGGFLAALRNSLGYGALVILALTPYFIGLLASPKRALSLFYGGSSPYLTLGPEVRLAVAAYAFGIPGAILIGYLLGVGRSKHAFAANAGAIAVSVLPTMLLIKRYGVMGAIAGLLCWLFVRTVLNIFITRHIIRSEEIQPSIGMKYFVRESEDAALGSSIAK